MGDYEDSIIQHYQNDSDNIDVRVCSEEAKLCSERLPKSKQRVAEEL